ncbi:MAG: methylated-DNA--[protein]-cysteine S-methyltransferase [Faecousia sp.]
MRYCQYDSPLGRLLLTGDDAGLTGVWMDANAPKDALPGEDDPVLILTKGWLDRYFRGENPTMDIPLAPKGTAFQHQVWKRLLAIPYGEVCTYGDLAREMAALLGKKAMSAQAIGGAVGHNPISILIPCHRVVGAKGKLTGYAGGLNRKAWLLRHEGWLKEQGDSV